MKVKFIKKHISGIKEGSVLELSKDHAERLIEEGYVEEFKEKKARVRKAPQNKKAQPVESKEK